MTNELQRIGIKIYALKDLYYSGKDTAQLHTKVTYHISFRTAYKNNMQKSGVLRIVARITKQN